MADFVFYYASPVLAKYDIKKHQYKRATFATTLRRLSVFLKMIFISGAVASAYTMFPSIFPPLAKSSSIESLSWYDWRTLINPSTLWANLLYAAFFQCYLTTFAEGMMFIQTFLTGIETEETMNNPVFGATSPSNFWGRRWNLLIHDVLKRGVFLPVRRYSSTTGALLATFFASGVFHEWLQITVFPEWDHEVAPDGSCHLLGREGTFSSLHCYVPVYGTSIAFFMWQAFLIAIEFTVGPYCKVFFLRVPDPLKTLMTVAAGGCVAHWFTEPYVHSTFFLDGDAAFCLWRFAPN